MTDTLRNEAAGVPATVEWRGHSITLASTLEEAPVEALEALEEGKATGFVKALITDATYRQLKRKGALKTVGDFSDLAEAIGRALGFAELGE